MESANTRAVPELGRSVYGLSSAETIGSDLVRRLGAVDLGELRAMDGETLTVAATKAGFAAQGTIDGHVLPRQAIDTFDRGEQEHLPLLDGFKSAEPHSHTVLPPTQPPRAPPE